MTSFFGVPSSESDGNIGLEIKDTVYPLCLYVWNIHFSLNLCSQAFSNDDETGVTFLSLPFYEHTLLFSWLKEMFVEDLTDLHVFPKLNMKYLIMSIAHCVTYMLKPQTVLQTLNIKYILEFIPEVLI